MGTHALPCPASKCFSEHTSRMLGMMSTSHCLRNWSLSKFGSARRISVRTSDISVLEKSPPGETVLDNYVGTKRKTEKGGREKLSFEDVCEKAEHPKGVIPELGRMILHPSSFLIKLKTTNHGLVWEVEKCCSCESDLQTRTFVIWILPWIH